MIYGNVRRPLHPAEQRAALLDRAIDGLYNLRRDGVERELGFKVADGR